MIPPPRCMPIGLKWVDKVKRNSHGNILGYKARVEAKGYVQKYDIDHEDVFTVVVRIETTSWCRTHF